MNKRILFVDDEPVILRALGRLFRKEGYQIHTAESGKDALELLQEVEVDIVVSDMRMPEMDGSELLANVKKMYPQTVRIVLTGYADMDATIKAINNAGVFGYLTKPWDGDQLKGIIQSAFNMSVSTRKNKLAVASLIRGHDELKCKVASQQREMAMADRYVRDAYNALQDGYGCMEEVLVNLLNLKDPTQREVIESVVSVVDQIAKQLCLNEQEQTMLQTAAKLHSVGKIGLPDEILMKPFNSLTKNERIQYMENQANSACTVLAFEPYQEISQLLLLQKSYLDGTGNIADKTLTDVSLYARLLTVAIDYVEFRTGRMTGLAVSHENTVNELYKHATRYDERMIALISTVTMHVSIIKDEADIQVPVMSLRNDMILNKDIFTAQGTLVLKEKTVFTETIIAQLQRIQRNMDTPLIVSVRFESDGDSKVA